MNNYISKRLFQGFICLHILYHAGLKPIYGSYMIEELSEHGYKLSPGTLFPILHSLEREGMLECYSENAEGKIRKYYTITELGKGEFIKTKKYLSELISEIG